MEFFSGKKSDIKCWGWDADAEGDFGHGSQRCPMVRQYLSRALGSEGASNVDIRKFQAE
jgi:hypothetical protein